MTMTNQKLNELVKRFDEVISSIEREDQNAPDYREFLNMKYILISTHVHIEKEKMLYEMRSSKQKELELKKCVNIFSSAESAMPLKAHEATADELKHCMVSARNVVLEQVADINT